MRTQSHTRNLLIASLLLASCVLTPLRAQTAAAPAGKSASTESKIVRLNRAPVSNEILKVHLPRPTKKVLPNGLRVLVLEDHRSPTVSLNLSVEGAGGLFDPSDRPGLASMAAGLMRQGTQARSAKELSESIDRLGASVNVNAWSGGTDASITAGGLKDNFDQWLAITAEVLLHPAFSQNELDIAKQRELAQLKQLDASPRFLSNKYFRKAIYGQSPASVVSSTPESINAMNVEQLKQWYQQRYTPQNSILIVAGDVTPAEVYPKIEQALKDWKKTDLKIELPADPAPAKATKVVLVDRPASVQTNLVLGNLGINRKDSDYVPLTVTNSILGGGVSGRLFMKLREEKGYTYGAYSYFDADEYRGPVEANSEVRSAVTEGALQEFFNEFHRLAEQPTPEDELKRHQRSLVAGFALSLESRGELMSDAMVVERYGFPENYWDQYAEQVMAVTSTDVQKMAAKYFTPSALQVVAVGDPSIKPILAKWGAVEEIPSATAAPTAGK